MNIVFMGTPDFAVPHLHRLMAGEFNVAGVVTRPDRPAGRGHALQAPPVKEAARSYDLRLWQPDKLHDESFKQQLTELQPDLICVVAYGAFLPSWLLDLPRHGCVNVHPSLLPLYRGAAPIQRAIMNGDTETGLSTMYMVEAMDAGDVILQQRTPISKEDDAGTLHERLSHIGADLLYKTIQLIDRGQAPRHVQDEKLVTLAPRITEADTRINWLHHAAAIDCQVRGVRPRPGAYTTLAGKRVKVWQTRPEATVPGERAEPGTIVADDDDGLLVAAGQGCLRLLQVQPENRRAMKATDFANGYRLGPGDQFV